jgi:phosphoglycerate dehydrogenase-like enzyme
MPKVLIASGILRDLDRPFLKLLRDAGLEIAFPGPRRQLTEADLMVELKGVTASLAGAEPYTRRVLEASPELRVIARTGVGYDAIDVAAANECGIAVAITPGGNHESVAEHTLALMLALARSIVPQHDAIHAGNWRREIGVPLRGRTLGLIGLGRIGREVALRAAAFRMPLLAYEPFPDAPFVEKHGVRLVPMDRLLAESDFVSLHIPLSNESRNLIDARALALMKPGAFLINTARGGIINEDDLATALREKRIGGAALDVFANEPPPIDHPLLKFENVICTAHTAGVDQQARDDMGYQAAHAIAALSRSEWPADQIVNPDCRPKHRWP